jgi:hypothetical protein
VLAKSPRDANRGDRSDFAPDPGVHIAPEVLSAGHALGQKIHEADRWIAASAIRLGVELVSDDSVFTDVPALTVLSRPSPDPVRAAARAVPVKHVMATVVIRAS